MSERTVERTVEREVVLVTGGTRGIGRAAAWELGKRGSTVVLVGQDLTRSLRVADEFVAAGIDAVGEAADVSDAASMNALAQRLGPLAEPDTVIISAGVMSERMARTVRTTADEWDRVMGINLNGAFHAMRVFGPAMVKRRSGRVIAVSACLGRFTGPGLAGGLAPYRVSKAALNALTRNFAAETSFGERGVLVDAMCPNHCRTDMGGPEAPRSAEEGADTIVWLATRPHTPDTPTGLLWEDRQVIPW